jgi:hypothetical protein
MRHEVLLLRLPIGVVEVNEIDISHAVIRSEAESPVPDGLGDCGSDKPTVRERDSQPRPDDWP